MYYFYYTARNFTRPLYKIKGLGFGRICELIRRHAASHPPKTPIIINDFRGNCKFNCYLNEHMGGQIFFKGSYSGSQLKILERILKTNSVFIDAGANQGEFSITAANIIKTGKVIAFEPVSALRKRFTKNVEINKFNIIKLLPVALSDENGEMPIYNQKEAFHDGSYHEGLTTLYKSKNRSSVCEIVKVRKLDDVLDDLSVKKVDLIKLDIEGAEYPALRGAINTIKKHKPVLILEIGKDTCKSAGYEATEFAEWLIRQGYKLETILDDSSTENITPDQLSNFQNILAQPI